MVVLCVKQPTPHSTDLSIFSSSDPLFAQSPLISYQTGGRSGNSADDNGPLGVLQQFFPRKRMASREGIEVARRKETQWSVHCLLSPVKLGSVRRKEAETFMGNGWQQRCVMTSHSEGELRSQKRKFTRSI